MTSMKSRFAAIAAGTLLGLPALVVAQANGWTENVPANTIYTTNIGRLVGVGTTAPSQRFHLGSGNIQLPSGNATADGNIFLGGISVNGQAGMRLFGGLVNGSFESGYIDVTAHGTSANGLIIRVDDQLGGTERMRITNQGNIGIGTPAPIAHLELIGTAEVTPVEGYDVNNTSKGNVLRVGTATNRVFDGGVITFTTGGGIGAYMKSGAVNGVSSRLYMGTNKGVSVMSPDLTIDQFGNVGIGTTNPTAKLEVNGAVIGTNIRAQYQDIAEWVPSTTRIAAGTVVILDQSRTNAVVPSGTTYDTRVAGVVSAKPGLILGQEGQGKVLVATTGRVKVKVDAAHAPIHIGDLLVTSDRKGVAMRSEPVVVGGLALHRPGTLIGKALESLETGQGEILVLLSLQ